jgi:hypothetical protein
MTFWALRLNPAQHPGLFEALAGALCASARVCLNRHHTSPTRLSIQLDGDEPAEHELDWANPTQSERNANANHLDAARDGGYAVALVCLEQRMRLVAVGRAEHATGADWYVAPADSGITEDGAPNLDDPEVMRLEVGGHDDRPSLPYELKLKTQQLGRGKSAIPGIAAIVGFKKARVLIATNILAA